MEESGDDQDQSTATVETSDGNPQEVGQGKAVSSQVEPSVAENEETKEEERVSGAGAALPEVVQAVSGAEPQLSTRRPPDPQ